jgi:hypothetical protein
MLVFPSLIPHANSSFRTSILWSKRYFSPTTQMKQTVGLCISHKDGLNALTSRVYGWETTHVVILLKVRVLDFQALCWWTIGQDLNDGLLIRPCGEESERHLKTNKVTNSWICEYAKLSIDGVSINIIKNVYCPIIIYIIILSLYNPLIVTSLHNWLILVDTVIRSLYF